MALSFDRDWAQSVVGLKVSVPTSWWQGCDDNDLNDGIIATVDFTEGNQRYFQRLLDDDKDDADASDDLRELYYPMRYDAVFLYANDDQSQQFRLPRRQVILPDGGLTEFLRRQKLSFVARPGAPQSAITIRRGAISDHRPRRQT